MDAMQPEDSLYPISTRSGLRYDFRYSGKRAWCSVMVAVTRRTCSELIPGSHSSFCTLLTVSVICIMLKNAGGMGTESIQEGQSSSLPKKSMLSPDDFKKLRTLIRDEIRPVKEDLETVKKDVSEIK